MALNIFLTALNAFTILAALFASVRMFGEWRKYENGYRRMRWYLFILLVSFMVERIPSMVYSMGLSHWIDGLSIIGAVSSANAMIAILLMLHYVPREQK